jgi:hypothetical protein
MTAAMQGHGDAFLCNNTCFEKMASGELQVSVEAWGPKLMRG